MYYITDKQSAIKTVQRFLGQNQTGVYNAGTAKSVIAHQEEKGIEKSGIVDYETFNSLKENYLENNEFPIIFTQFPYKTGDSGTDITMLNAIIGEVIGEYTFEGLTESGSYYSTNTAEAVARLREIFMLSDSANVDREFLNRLLREKNAINLSKKNR